MRISKITTIQAEQLGFVMTGRNYTSKVANRISPGAGDVIFNIHPKSNEEINDDGRTHCEKGNINKIFPDC